MSATPVTADVQADEFIDFEEFPEYTLIKEQYAPKNIHFLGDSLNGGTFRAAPLIINHTNAKSPSRVLVNSYSEWELYNSKNTSLVIWFDKPVSGVGMWLGSVDDPIHGSACDMLINATVSAYSCSGFQQGEVEVQASSAFNTPVEIIDEDGFSLVVIDYGDSLCPEAIDDLAFNYATTECTDTAYPLVQITSPIDSRYQDRLTVNEKNQTIEGFVATDGILSSVKVNGIPAQYYLNSSMVDPVFGRIYDFKGKVTLHEGGNYITVLAENPYGKTGSDHITLDLSTPTTATLQQFHLTQRGVMQNMACDVDEPLIAGKSALVRIDLDVEDEQGHSTYASHVEMTVWKQEAGKDWPIGTLWGWIYSPLVSAFNTPNDMSSIHFWVPGDMLDPQGAYKFTFRPYAGLDPIGENLTPQCGSSEYFIFENTRPIELVVLPVEANIYSPLLDNHTEYVAKQIHALIRTFPVRDYGQKGLMLSELSPFRLCDGSLNSVVINPNYCKGTGFNWTFVKRGTGFELLRADTETVVDATINACNSNDHQIGGRVKSGATFSYSDIPDLGIYLAGAHPSWEGAKYFVPLDSDHDGSIDQSDLAHFIAEFYDNQTKQWTTDLTMYDQGETFRFFVDDDNDYCNDRFDDPQADIRQLWENEQAILWGPAEDARNAYCDEHSCNRFPLFSFWFPDEFIPKDSRFGDIGPGQAKCPGSISWIKIRNASALPHELGHNVGGLLDLYRADIDPADDDLVTKENAWAVYIDTESVPPADVFAVMGYDRYPNRVVHYKPHYERLYDNMTASPYLTMEVSAMKEASDQFVANGWINIDTQELDLHTDLRSGLPLTQPDASSDYALVFGSDTTELSTFKFPVDYYLSYIEGVPDYPVSIINVNIVTTFPDSTEWVEVRYQGESLARYNKSTQPPTVSLGYPNGGENLGASGTVNVKWDSSDPDGDTLLHTLYYSNDGGTSWMVVAAGAGGTEYAWDLTTAPGTTDKNGLLRIVASDGFNTAKDTSGGFSVAGKPPVAAIIEPHSGRTYLECERIMLTGFAIDPDEEVLQYAWTVDGQPAGDGERIALAPLPYGDHEITLTVTDGEGHTAQDQVTITVFADSDCDGMSNQYENLYGLEPGFAEDAAEDLDGDGLINFDEAYYNTNPKNPDTDGDGIMDGEDKSPVTPANEPPWADANGPYEVNEGTPVTLDASGASDPEGEILSYRWDLDDDGIWDTPWLMDPTLQVMWCDDYSGDTVVQVRDPHGLLSDDSASVTVNNVAPTALIDLDQPNPQFILPMVHTLTFNGSFIDPGCDSWTFAWDFDGDGSTDSNDQNPNYVYSEPGTYNVTFRVTDDDGGIGINETEVTVFNETEAKHDLADYIQTVPDNIFKGKAEQRKNAFAQIFDALDDMIADEEWNGFITSLQNNVRSKADGTIDGKSKDDWITNDTEQQHICMKVDDIVAYIETFM
jgi:hypothetical protein